jgi:amino acid transporter
MKTPPSSQTASSLARVLGPWTAVAVVVGTVIGSGVFKKPQSIAENVGQFGLVATVWVLGGLLAFLGALAYAEVATLYPRAGGNYVFLREGYGRLAGFLWGWVEFLIIRAASLAALATIFTESLHDVLLSPPVQEALGLPAGSRLGFWSQRWLTVAVLLMLTMVNVRGAKWGGGLQLIVTLVKVGSLLAIAVLPFYFLMRAGPTPGGAAPTAEYLRPTWPTHWSEVAVAGLGTALLGVLWAYHGWMNIAPVAEEVQRPQRNIPLALLGGVGIVMALYLSANLAYSLVIPRGEMAGLRDTTVAAEFGKRLLGPAGTALAAGAVMCSVFGALNGNLLVGPRLLYAMGQDGLAPRALQAVHPRYHTPALAILVLGAWSVLLVLAVAVLTETGLLARDKSHFDRLTDFAMFGAVIFETMAVLSIFVFRRRRPDAERPYRCWGYPVVPALYVVLPAFILTNMFTSQPFEAISGLGFIAAGVGVYFALGLDATGPRPVLPPVDLSPAPRPLPEDAIAPADDKVRP